MIEGWNKFNEGYKSNKDKSREYWNSIDREQRELVLDNFANFLNSIGYYDVEIDIEPYINTLIGMDYDNLIKYNGKYEKDRMQASDLRDSIYYHLKLGDWADE